MSVPSRLPREALRQMILPERLERMERVLEHRTNSLTVLTEDVEFDHNQAAVLRTCEAFGLQTVHVSATNGGFRPSRRVTQGCDRWLTVVRHDDPVAAVEHLHREGFVVLASCLEEDAIPMQEVDFTKKTALVFGNERVGVSDRLKQACDGSFHIPMFGFTQSFNISVATALVIHEAVRQRLAAEARIGDLTAAERESLEHHWLEMSVLYTRPKRVDLRGGGRNSRNRDGG